MIKEQLPVGTKVKIANKAYFDSFEGSFPRPSFNTEMRRYVNYEAVITASWIEDSATNLFYYTIDADNDGWLWANWMFEKIIPDHNLLEIE